MSSLPDGLRVHAFAATELMLDIVYAARKIADFDLESVLVYYCANEATMRPMILGTPAQRAHVNDIHPPSDARGWISRRGLADRTGLARETVRRKAQALIAAGYLEEDAKGHVRVAPRLDDPQVQAAMIDVQAAIQRYLARINGAA